MSHFFILSLYCKRVANLKCAYKNLIIIIIIIIIVVVIIIIIIIIIYPFAPSPSTAY